MDYHLSLYIPNVHRENEKYVHPLDRKIMESRLKINKNKKYQISGYHEFKILDNILKNNNDVEYSLLQNDTLFKNVVTHIFC